MAANGITLKNGENLDFSSNSINNDGVVIGGSQGGEPTQQGDSDECITSEVDYIRKLYYTDGDEIPVTIMPDCEPDTLKVFTEIMLELSEDFVSMSKDEFIDQLKNRGINASFVPTMTPDIPEIFLISSKS